MGAFGLNFVRSNIYFPPHPPVLSVHCIGGDTFRFFLPIIAHTWDILGRRSTHSESPTPSTFIAGANLHYSYLWLVSIYSMHNDFRFDAAIIFLDEQQLFRRNYKDCQEANPRLQAFSTISRSNASLTFQELYVVLERTRLPALISGTGL